MARSVDGGSGALNSVLKALFARARPDLVEHLVVVVTPSFPSGHALLSAAVYPMLAAVTGRELERLAFRRYLFALAAFLVLLIGITRIYLGVHWPSDVLAGWFIGSLWAWHRHKGVEACPSRSGIVAGKGRVLFAALAGMLAAFLVMNFAMPEKRIKQSLTHQYGVADPQFRHELGTLLGPPIVDGNIAANLENGNEIFPAMLEEIRGAKHTITFETYIYWSGEIGETFSQALAERAQAGVKVHVLMDWVGSQKIDERFPGCR